MSAAFEGIRVIDWTVFQQGPVASMIMGDMGADVIKVEERGVGDPARSMMKVAGVSLSAGVSQRNAYFEAGNRNKRGIAIDLSKDKGKHIIYELVAKSDVFIQNFRGGVAEKSGMDYKTLSQYNPRLIYAHASGWGPRGPDSLEPSADFTGMARSGLMCMVGEPGMPPLSIQGGLGDQIGGVMTAMGVMAALFYREKTGVGQELEASLLGSLVFQLGHIVTMNTISGLPTPKSIRKKAGNPLWNYYQCGDGKWIALAGLAPDRFWPNLCRALGLQRLEKDERFDSMEKRGKNCEDLISILDKTFATKPRDEWVKLMKKEKMIYGVLNDIPDLKSDSQILANDYITRFDHPTWGPIQMVGLPITFEKTPMSLRREAPEFGQHTEEILIEVLGYTWEEIGQLKEQEVI